VLEPVTMLQGAESHPCMLMARASYTEPVTKQWRNYSVVETPSCLLSGTVITDHTASKFRI
jgi:hypothetical protein